MRDHWELNPRKITLHPLVILEWLPPRPLYYQWMLWAFEFWVCLLWGSSSLIGFHILDTFILGSWFFTFSWNGEIYVTYTSELWLSVPFHTGSLDFILVLYAFFVLKMFIMANKNGLWVHFILTALSHWKPFRYCFLVSTWLLIVYPTLLPACLQCTFGDVENMVLYSISDGPAPEQSTSGPKYTPCLELYWTSF